MVKKIMKRKWLLALVVAGVGYAAYHFLYKKGMMSDGLKVGDTTSDNTGIAGGLKVD